MIPNDLNKIYNLSNPPETPTKKRSSLNKILSNFEKYKLRAEGSFYKIFCTEKNTILRVSKKPLKNSLEVDILKMLDHPCVNKMIKFSIEDDFLVFEMEKAEMNLREAILENFFETEKDLNFLKLSDFEKHLRSKNFNETDFDGDFNYNKNEKKLMSFNLPKWSLYMIHNISSALSYIHKNKIIHMDLKPENILIKISKNTVVFQLCDFNVSIIEETEIDLDGDKIYMAPEILKNKAYYKSDVFSLGMIYLEIINKEIPKTGEEYHNLRKNNFTGFKVDKICVKMLHCNHNLRIDSLSVAEYFDSKLT